jgi:hypothetical protein
MGRLQNNPSIGWVHPKSTHAHSLAWGNKNMRVTNFPLLQKFGKLGEGRKFNDFLKMNHQKKINSKKKILKKSIFHTCR